MSNTPKPTQNEIYHNCSAHTGYRLKT